MEKWNDDENYDIKEPTWKRAVDYANKYHTEAGNFRIGKDGGKLPYITHIHEVMKILINEAHITSDDVLTVAALHDVLEDTACTKEQMTNDFGPYITGAVDLLTRKDNQPFEEYAKNIFTSQEYPWVGQIKLADRIHNLRTYPEVNDNARVQRKLDETKRVIVPYAEGASPVLSRKLQDAIGYVENFLNKDGIEL